MNKNSTVTPSTRLSRFGIWGTLVIAGTLVDESVASAQSVIANQAPTTPVTSEWQQSQPDEMDVFVPTGQTPGSDLPQIFHYGPLLLRPHANYRFLYGNGIQASVGNQQTTVVQELSPGLLVDLGAHWTVDYTPTFRFYSDDNFGDTVDHSVAVAGGGLVGDWKAGFSHGSSFTTAPLAESGGQTERSSHSTSLTASHAFNSKMSTDLGVSQNINLVNGFQDSYDWSTLDWLNYQFWPRLTAGLGAGGGYVSIDDNSHTRGANNLDQTYERVQARVQWRATQKISFQVSGGFEDRQFMTPGTGDSLDPVFGATIQYQPFKVTQLTLTASRTVSSSDYYLAAQQTETTTISLNLDQRLWQKFSLGMGVAYGATDFNTSVASSSSPNRSDDNVSFNVRLSHPFFKRGSWSVFYQFSDNHSTQPGFSFQSNQTGFEISYRF